MAFCYVIDNAGLQISFIFPASKSTHSIAELLLQRNSMFVLPNLAYYLGIWDTGVNLRWFKYKLSRMGFGENSSYFSSRKCLIFFAKENICATCLARVSVRDVKSVIRKQMFLRHVEFLPAVQHLSRQPQCV